MMWRYGGLCPFCGGSGGWGAGGLLMSLFGLLVLAGVVLFIIWAVRQASRPHERGPYIQGRPYDDSRSVTSPGPEEDSAVVAARHRYAQGEITKEELDEILANLRQTR